jgi:hypothetical protein
MAEFGKFFAVRNKELRDRGIRYDWKQNRIDALNKARDEAMTIRHDTINEKQREEARQTILKIDRQLQVMHDTNYASIPINILFERTIAQLNRKRGVRSVKDPGSEYTLKMLTGKKRQVENTVKLLERIKDEQLKEKVLKQVDPVKYILAYTKKFSKDMALLNIRDAMMADGILKTQGQVKPKGKKWVRTGVSYGVLRDNYVQAEALNMLDNLLTVNSKQNWFQKSMSVLKMSSFYNPLFLPIYDAFQSVMAGSLTAAPIKILPNMWRALSEVTFRNGAGYKEAMSLGLFSKPFDNPLKSYMDSAAGIKAAAGKGGMAGWMIQQGVDMAMDLKAHKGLPFKMAYNASWNIAWKLDETVRYFTYLQLVDNGFTKTEAAEIGARFHGDYASVPPKTRKYLNYVFFTPTFKIAMGKLYAEMISSVVKGTIRGAQGKSTKRQQQMMVGVMSVVAINAAFDWFMRVRGYEPEDDEWWNIGRKYVKVDDTRLGPQEFVFTWSNPGNMIQRFADKAAKASRAKGAMEGLSRFIGYDFHPVTRTALALNNNRDHSGAKIWHEYDSKAEKAARQIWFGFTDLVKMVGTTGPFNELPREGTRLAEERREQFTFLKLLTGHALAVANEYARDPKRVRLAAEIERMGRQHTRDQQAYVREYGTMNISWLQIYQERLAEKLRELESID